MEWGYQGIFLFALLGLIMGGFTAVLVRLTLRRSLVILGGLITLQVILVLTSIAMGFWNSIAPISNLISMVLVAALVFAISVRRGVGPPD